METGSAAEMDPRLPAASVVTALIAWLPGLSAVLVTDQFSVGTGDDLAALLTFVLVVLVVGTLVGRATELRVAAERREQEAAIARDEAAVSRSRAAFFAAAGHNLRTPLTTVAAAADALADPGLAISAEERTELLATIREETARLTRLVSNVLALSRVRSGAVEARREPCDVTGLLGSVIRRLPADERARIAIEVTEGTGDEISIDVELAEQVLLNLLENASGHTPPGSPVEVTARTTVRDGRVGTELRVVDHGPGIPEEEREMVTNEFFRGDRAPQGGSGLGLAIARALAEADGGDLTIGATPGGGATIGLWYPVDVPPAGATGP